MQIAQNFNVLTQKNSLAKLRQGQILWALLLLAVLGITALLSLWMALKGPDIRILAWFIFACGAAAILYQPRWGVYLILFFSLVGDPLLSPAYPFVKNFSSTEFDLLSARFAHLQPDGGLPGSGVRVLAGPRHLAA